MSSEAVGNYQEACELWARNYVGWNNAELDDLVQEGLIAVWTSLEAGVHPSRVVITGRMQDYVRALGRQMGQGYGDELTYVPIDTVDEAVDTAAYEDWFSKEFQD